MQPRSGLRHVTGQHRGGHRANAAGDRRDGVRHRFCSSKVHVAHQHPIRIQVDANVDDRLTGGDMGYAQHPGFPGRRDEHVGRRHSAARSAVRVWQSVTVAFRCSSSMAAGFPMTRLRPTTTARLPVSS